VEELTLQHCISINIMFSVSAFGRLVLFLLLGQDRRLRELLGLWWLSSWLSCKSFRRLSLVNISLKGWDFDWGG